jgi:hypothetical protein
MVIRQDERKIIAAQYGLSLAMPISADGRVTLNGGVRGAE